MANTGKFQYGVEFNVNKDSLKNIKAEINELTLSLQQIQTQAKQAKILGNLDKDLEQASKEAKKLEEILNASWNPKLNQLNLTKFEQNIKTSYGNVEKLRISLNNIGQGGTFNKLANEILGTNLQLKTTGTLLDKMSITFANTVRYGISSSIFNNLTNSISKAYNYTKDLDKSLNDIRIVSDATASDMERFAKYANSAAKDLGASTLDYTKGALIYYQQGLDEEEVKKRTDITLKMSNVLGTSAQEVSDYMTAIWNNFDDGSQSLEYYADVLTKLGAATASSAEEISTGLEKFASISQTVGLSYEYAAAALTTVTATTRQSAEVVGTAFKTLFARIQGLNLGETLDDGTTLNKYSEALQAVGISIKDQNGELKGMDAILDEMGAKWETLNKDQQVALAQTVAGVRQYNQLMSLMNNWDFFKENVKTAENSAGELQKQQEIYMDSMKAHLQKLRTEAERTYDVIFDEKSVSSLADIATKALKQINDNIEGLGGGLNTIINLAAQLAVVFNKQLGSSLTRVFENLKIYWKENVQSIKIIENTIEEVKRQSVDIGVSSGTGMSTQYIDEQAETIKTALKYRKGLTNEQYNEIANDAKELALLKQKRDYLQQIKNIAEQDNDTTTLKQAKTDLKAIQDAQTKAADTFKNLSKSISEIESEGLTEDKAHLDQVKQTVQDILDLKYQNAEVDDMSFLTEQQKLELEKIAKQLSEDEYLNEDQKKFLDEIALQSKTYYIAKLQEQKELVEAIAKDEEKITIETDNQINSLEKKQSYRLKGAKDRAGAATGFQIAGAAIQGLTALTGAISSFTDENADGAQKANAAWQGVFGVGSAVANAILPGSGFIVQGIGAIGKSILEATGLWEGFEDLFKSSKEKLEEVRKELEEIKKVEAENLSQYADNKDAVKYFEDIKDRFSQLQSMAEKGLLTESLRSEYEGYLDKISQYNDNLVITYDEQGKKIAANSDIILKTIGLIQEENELLMSQTYNEESWDEFAKKKDKEYKEAKNSYRDQKEELERKYGRGNVNNDRWATGGKPVGEFSAGYNAGNPPDLSRRVSLVEDMLSTLNPDINPNVQAYGLTKEDIKFVADIIQGTVDKKESQRLKEITDEELHNLWDSIQEIYGQSLVDTEDTFGPKNKKVWDFYYDSIKNGDLDSDLDRWNRELIYAKKSTIGSIKLDSSYLLNDIKYSSENQGDYSAFQDLGIENADQLLAAYIDGINIENEKFKDDKGNVKYDKIRDHVVEIQQNIVKALAGDPSLVDEINNINAFSSLGLTSEEYEKQLQAKIEEFLSHIKTEDQFNQIKDLLPTLFGVKSVSAQWTDKGATLGLNGGNIVTNGEGIARQFGNIIAEQNIVNDEDKNTVSNEIEKYLQQQLSETDLKNLDTSKLAEDFNTLLAEAIDSEDNDSLTQILQKAIDKQNINSVGSDIDSFIAQKDSSIQKYNLDTDELKEYSQYISKTSKEADDLADSLEEDGRASAVVAKSVMRMNNGIKDLAENFDEWNDVLKNSSKSSEEYWKALENVRTAIANVLDVEENFISDNFIEEHLKDIEDAANGNAEAIERLRNHYADALVLEIAVQNEVPIEVQSRLSSLVDEVQSMIPKIEVGATINVDDKKFGDFFQKCTDIINAAGMTTEQANAFFDAIGFDAQVETKYERQKSQEPVTETTEIVEWKPSTITYDAGDGKTETRNARAKHTITSTKTIGYTESETVVPVIAMATNGKTPVIHSLTKKGTGSMNNYSSTNKGGGSPGKSSGGGGGGSSKPKKTDPLKDEADRYHQINAQIKLVSNELDKLDKQQKKTFGKDYLNNLNKQYSLLNKQITNYNEKLKIAQGEQNELNKKLSGQGVKFNSDGTVSNYMQAFAAQEAYVNGLIDQYNRLSAAEQEKWDEAKTIDNAKERFDEFKKDLDRYDELVTDFIPDLQKNIQDAVDKQIELNIEKFNYEIKIRLDMSEAQRDWNQFLADIKKNGNLSDSIEGDIVRNLQARRNNFDTYFNASGNGSIQAQTQHINDLLNEIYKMDNGQSNVYGDNRQQALEDLKEYYEQLISDLRDIVELQKEVHAAYGDMVDEAQEKFDEQVEAFEHISKLVEHDMKLIELVNGEDAYDKLAHYYQIQQDNYNQQLDFQRKQVDFWEQQMNALEEGSEEWKIAKDQWAEALENWQALVEESIENIRNKFENTINNIFKNLNNQITNGLGLDYVADQWDLISKNADQYLDAINAAQGIRDLEKKYLDAIEKTDNVGAQRKLNALMNKELGDLRDKDKLSEYDLERAEKKYQLLLAQIALEEAQQNKNNMRLRRDSQGNYTYQFVADDDEVRKAQDELDKAYNSLYNFDKEAYISNLDEIYSTWDEYQQKMYEASLINDPEARLQKELLIQQQYGDLITALTEKNMDLRNNLHESAFQDLANLYDENIDNFYALSDAEQDMLLGSLIPQWDSAVQAMADKFSGPDGFTAQTKDALDQIHAAAAQLADDLAQVGDTANVDFDAIGEGLDENLPKLEQLVLDNEELIQKYDLELEKVREVIEEVDNLYKAYEKAKNEAIAATDAAFKYTQAQNGQAATAAANNSRTTTAGPSAQNNQAALSSSASGYKLGIAYPIEEGDSLPGIAAKMYGDSSLWREIYKNNENVLKQGLIAGQILQLASGGYTGNWAGNSGRLAALHKKELVLNAKDTENMLNAVSVMRYIVDSVGDSVLSRLASLSGGIGSPKSEITTNREMEQNVHIDATFPNATNAKEIEDAFNNLVNIASQRAYKTN